MDLTGLSKPISPSVFRNAGEKAAALFPGIEDMGKKIPAKVGSRCRISGHCPEDVQACPCLDSQIIWLPFLKPRPDNMLQLGAICQSVV